ncbi:recombination protein NinB [Henriciella sp.]|uniref:recombination protein NinB n=1 Tax=Henriciella sp. TaxID=1968823 RepID=UPI00260776C7|nr:recombination protein NinB [Henriciella sp.]
MRWQLTINSHKARQTALEWISKAPWGYRLTLQETKRTVPQNDRMWAMLSAVSTQLVWHGQRYDTDAWKDFFMHMLHGGRFMPAEDGGMVPIGRHTSKLGKQEHSLLQEIIEGFAERHGVDLMAPNEKDQAA